MQSHVPKIVNAIYDLYSRCSTHLKPTPIKVHYAFNQKAMFRMAKNICKVENNYVKNVDCLVKLFYHEAMR